jgi:hypothetical protein
MQQDIDCQGQIQVSSNTVNGGGTQSVSADLPQGPPPGKIWYVDAAGFIMLDANGADAFSSLTAGLYLVPVSAPSADSTDSGNGLSLASRGVPLTQTYQEFNFAEGIGAGQMYGQMAASHPFIVPSGFTVRAIVSSQLATPIAGPCQLTVFAQIRILNQQ